jgi:uncharacterized protein YbbK (DUF523 family)
MAKILVSNCLLGCECRYKGDGCRCDGVLALAPEHTLIGVCPEQAGGLPTPRDPSEIQGERVMSCSGADNTEHYSRGAEIALHLAKLNQVDFAIMKAKSPSCGKGRIYDGSFTGAMCDGNGVTVSLLLQNGIPVFTEDELDKLPL